jgi:reprolysin-like metallo-peptidase family M12B
VTACGMRCHLAVNFCKTTKCTTILAILTGGEMVFRTFRLLFLVLLLFTPVLVFAIDSDGDGLSDPVEAQLGSSAYHKDVFVEIDWFIVNGHSFKPRKGFDAIAKAIFADAPVSNPDGTTGINLHISYSDGIRINNQALGYTQQNGAYNWNDFDTVKSIYFTPSRWNTHHYCLFVKDLGDQNGHPTGTSGISRNGAKFTTGASDFIIALGSNYWWNYPKKAEYKWTQAGTFAHELGHNLGLRHGGNDHTNYKPNLLSIMNYSFQTDGIQFTAFDGTRYFIYDFSRQLLPPLTETNLNEGTCLGPKAADNIDVYNTGGGHFGTSWYVWNGSNYEGHYTWDATSFCDWDANGVYNTGVVEDINQSGRYEKLKGFNQWKQKLSYNGGWVGARLSDKQSALPIETSYPCLTANEHRAHKLERDPNARRATWKDVIEHYKTSQKKK